jgi:adenylosuccinate synthase
MSSLVVVGTQWGDEGKGKIVDLLTGRFDVVVRFGGGNNAGHTLVVDGEQVILHLIPSGILHPGKCVVLGDGMVIDPEALVDEIEQLARIGGRACTLDADSLKISTRAHLILPYHRVLDGLREGTSGALGTTRRGVGPAYEDKAARRGVRMGDLVRPGRLQRRLPPALEEANARITRLGGDPIDLDPLQERLLELGRRLQPHLTQTYSLINDAVSRGQRLLFEGAQGVLLDIDHGTYPFVTSSSTVAGGVSPGCGIGPRNLSEVVGVAKAYVTRVGEGPFPTEVSGEVGDRLREEGGEYGATTGRPRRCGWLDLVALRYATEVSGVTSLAVTKLDVLSGITPLWVCRTYRDRRGPLEHFPDDVSELEEIEPVLEEIRSFDGDLSAIRSFEELPAGAREYISMIEQETGVPVSFISVGPERNQTVIRDDGARGPDIG